MPVPVFELQGTTSNMYFVNVDLMNSVLYLLYLRLELFGHLKQNCLASINAKLVRANKHDVFSYLTIVFYFILCSILKTAIEPSI